MRRIKSAQFKMPSETWDKDENAKETKRIRGDDPTGRTFRVLVAAKFELENKFLMVLDHLLGREPPVAHVGPRGDH